MTRDLRAEIQRILQGRQPGELTAVPMPHRAHLVWAMRQIERLESELKLRDEENDRLTALVGQWIRKARDRDPTPDEEPAMQRDERHLEIRPSLGDA